MACAYQRFGNSEESQASVESLNTGGVGSISFWKGSTRLRTRNPPDRSLPALSLVQTICALAEWLAQACTGREVRKR